MSIYTWYTDKLDLESAGTIHQILAYGSLTSLREVLNKQGVEKIRKIFLEEPQKVYTPSALNFISKYILKIVDHLDENKYLKSSPRNIG